MNLAELNVAFEITQIAIFAFVQNHHFWFRRRERERKRGNSRNCEWAMRCDNRVHFLISIYSACRRLFCEISWRWLLRIFDQKLWLISVLLLRKCCAILPLCLFLYFVQCWIELHDGHVWCSNRLHILLLYLFVVSLVLMRISFIWIVNSLPSGLFVKKTALEYPNIWHICAIHNIFFLSIKLRLCEQKHISKASIHQIFRFVYFDFDLFFRYKITLPRTIVINSDFTSIFESFISQMKIKRKLNKTKKLCRKIKSRDGRGDREREGESAPR